MQVILIPEVNDGKNLDVTISSLAKLYPKVASIAVVPVGLTRHRQGLTPIKPVSTYLAKQTLNQIKRFQEKYLQEHGTPIVHASDEFYLNTQESFPPREQYGSFEQLENGVGLVQLLLKEFDELSTRFPESTHSYNLEADVVCGKLVAGVLDPIINWFNNLPGISLYLHPVTNNFFGDSITVTGLLTGSDIIQEFKASRDKKTILIPAVTLKYGESVFLDDMSVSQVSSMLNRPVKTFDPTVKGLLDIINCIKRS